ncbi:MAG TPA: fatty acid desaturase [Vicinamibacterales bacterium]|nr:fatty acid desaturase [Vicinamibacterales bacterium]
MAPKSELYSAVEPFGRPSRSRAVFEILVTFVPYLVLAISMMVLAGRGHVWPVIALMLPAAAFLVRIFIIFHDCTHGSFFRSRRANRLLGYAAGLLTLTPFERWQRSHAEHHAGVGDLERRGTGDVWTLTVEEYLAAPRWKRLFYRVFRNPFVLLGIGPGFLFVLYNRWPWSGSNANERFSVHFTNAAMAVTLVAAYLTVGLPVFLATQVPTLLLAAMGGVWLFYVQHQFEEAYWARRPDWQPIKAALEGSSYYKLPGVLQWISGSIGLHHIHHVQPRIPFYNLQQCQEAVPAFQAVPPLTIRRSLHSLRLRLVDESRGRMVRLSEIDEGRSRRRPSGTAVEHPSP